MTTETSATPPEVIDVELVPLPSPLRLASPAFITSLREVEGQIAALKITDAASAQAAATLQQRLTKAGTTLEATRKTLKAPFKEQGDKIDAIAAGPAGRIEHAKRTLKDALTAYDDECRRIAAKAEEDRQKELARLEGLRLAEEKAAKDKADALAREVAEAARLREEAAKAANKPLPVEEDFGEVPPAEPPPKTETEKAIEAIQYAPAVAAPKPEGIVWRTTLIPTVTDVKALPEIFVVRTPNLQAIRSTFCTGFKSGDPLPVCAGVRFDVKREPVGSR